MSKTKVKGAFYKLKRENKLCCKNNQMTIYKRPTDYAQVIKYKLWREIAYLQAVLGAKLIYFYVFFLGKH